MKDTKPKSFDEGESDIMHKNAISPESLAEARDLVSAHWLNIAPERAEIVEKAVAEALDKARREERVACADLCTDPPLTDEPSRENSYEHGWGNGFLDGAKWCADTIRARNTSEK